MLGLDTNEPFIVEGVYAENLLEAIRRKYMNGPNEEDLRAKERSEKIKSEYNAVWTEYKYFNGEILERIEIVDQDQTDF